MKKRSVVTAAIVLPVVVVAVAVAVMALRLHRASNAIPVASDSEGAITVTVRVAKPFDIADAGEVIYDGKLTPGWNDWGWGSHDLSNHGPAKIGFGGYGGIILQHPMIRTRFAGISFRYKAPASWPEFLQVTLKFSGGQAAEFPVIAVASRNLAPLPDGFQEAFLPWNELNPASAPFDRIVISAALQVGAEPVLIDKILLLRSEVARPDPPPQRAVELEVRCDAAPHTISPLIYGSSNADAHTGTTTWRLGGNPTSRYNWDLNAWNTANDWFFENVKAVNLDAWLDDAAKQGVPVSITVPMLGWVAKDTSSVGFPVSSFGKQQKIDPNRPQAGNGYDARGEPIKPEQPSVTSIEAPPDLVARWVSGVHAKERNGTRIVRSYILDNEPSLWDQTHRDVHPDPLTYDELLDRTIRYASAIRKADPEAQIAGPAEWGWLGYFYSAKDRVEGKFIRSDRRAHGDVPLIPWYLKRLAQYERDQGTRLLDVLDVHFYPAADGMYGENARTDAGAAELRLRSTRALWDPSYVDESWINEPVQLIPRLKGWVAANYPGLRISLGEWSFGADAHISGALATAEALGRFGQQDIDSAFYWGGPKEGTGTFWAFRAFRNFDGAGGRFQDLSVPTREADTVSIFASRDASGRHLVTVLVNRDPLFSAKAHLVLTACGTLRSQRAFGYASDSTALVEQPSEPLVAGAPVLMLPPYSLAVLDMQVDPPPGQDQ